MVNCLLKLWHKAKLKLKQQKPNWTSSCSRVKVRWSKLKSTVSKIQGLCSFTANVFYYNYNMALLPCNCHPYLHIFRYLKCSARKRRQMMTFPLDWPPPLLWHEAENFLALDLKLEVWHFNDYIFLSSQDLTINYLKTIFTVVVIHT